MATTYEYDFIIIAPAVLHALAVWAYTIFDTKNIEMAYLLPQVLRHPIELLFVEIFNRLWFFHRNGFLFLLLTGVTQILQNLMQRRKAHKGRRKKFKRFGH